MDIKILLQNLEAQRSLEASLWEYWLATGNVEVLHQWETALNSVVEAGRLYTYYRLRAPQNYPAGGK